MRGKGPDRRSGKGQRKSPKTKAQRGRLRRMVDRTIHPAKPTYQPPSDEACHSEVFYIYPTGDASDDHRLVVRQKIYRGNIVDFSINQVVLVERRWKDVARVDCCGGKIHRHQFDEEGNDMIGHELIKEIPPEDGWGVVREGYLNALDVLHDEWEENLRRWRHDPA